MSFIFILNFYTVVCYYCVHLMRLTILMLGIFILLQVASRRKNFVTNGELKKEFCYKWRVEVSILLQVAS